MSQKDKQAGMAELADAPDLGSGVHDVQVQVLLPALEITQKWRNWQTRTVQVRVMATS